MTVKDVGTQQIIKVFLKTFIEENLCEIIFEEVDRYDLLLMNKFVKEAEKYKPVNKCKPVTGDVSPNIHFCIHCGKEFKSRRKYKHTKYYCKAKKEDVDKDILIKELKERNEELKNMIEKLINSKIILKVQLISIEI